MSALQQLLDCLQGYAAEASNPVLEVLAGEPLIEQQHYPSQPLDFGGQRWRAYYHCHTQEFRFAGEHGHFHLFHALPGGDWTHVVGLCMDAEGQPLRWFCVNHWVVGGRWCHAQAIMALLDDVEIQAPRRVERWLLSMLDLYLDSLKPLLLARDSVVADVGALEDRQRYLLSEQRVDLLSRVNAIFNAQSHNETIT